MSTAMSISENGVGRGEGLGAGTFGEDSGAGLWGANALVQRLRVLDELDAILGAEETPAAGSDFAKFAGLRALRGRLEAANRELYEEARREMVREGNSRRFREWVGSAASGSAARGLSFDGRDEIVSGVLQLREPEVAEVAQAPEMLAYQPTPARHIVDVSSRLSPDDMLVDLGSGLGHVPLVVSILSGHCTLGVELQPAYVACARECATSLGLRQVQFVAKDARAASLSEGTVFYLYTPFTGSILGEVLARLRRESARRAIRIFSLGPCARVLEGEAWLEADGVVETGRIAVFAAR